MRSALPIYYPAKISKSLGARRELFGVSTLSKGICDVGVRILDLDKRDVNLR